MTSMALLLGLMGFVYGDGPEIFTEKKCQKCHSVASAQIEVIVDEEDDEDGDEPTDLSSIGNEMSSDDIQTFLMRKSERNEKKHKKRFKGSDEELQALADWLASLKAE